MNRLEWDARSESWSCSLRDYSSELLSVALCAQVVDRPTLLLLLDKRPPTPLATTSARLSTASIGIAEARPHLRQNLLLVQPRLLRPSGASRSFPTALYAATRPTLTLVSSLNFRSLGPLSLDYCFGGLRQAPSTRATCFTSPGTSVSLPGRRRPSSTQRTGRLLRRNLLRPSPPSPPLARWT